jgi:hypothetical protein
VEAEIVYRFVIVTNTDVYPHISLVYEFIHILYDSEFTSVSISLCVSNRPHIITHFMFERAGLNGRAV